MQLNQTFVEQRPKKLLLQCDKDKHEHICYDKRIMDGSLILLKVPLVMEPGGSNNPTEIYFPCKIKQSASSTKTGILETRKVHKL